MKILRNISYLSLFFYFSGFSTGPTMHTGAFIYIPKEMKVHEDITYVVKYGFIELGEVRLVVLEKKEANGQKYYKTKAYMDSYDVPFVSLHQIYESYFNEKQYSTFFRHTEREKNYVKFTEYYFDYQKNKLSVKKGKFNPFQMWTDSSTVLNTHYQDGLSLFYYARMNNGQQKTVTVPCFVTEKFETTKINFYNTIENISISAVDYSIPCTKLDGHTNMVSVFGLTGNFEGWFTNDKYAVPTIAKMKVIIGNVTLELMKWRNKDWNPPRAK